MAASDSRQLHLLQGVPSYPSPWRLQLVVVGQLLGVFPLRRLGGVGARTPIWQLSRLLQLFSVVGVFTSSVCFYNFFAVVKLPGQGLKGTLQRWSLIFYAVSGLPCALGALCYGRRLERFSNSLLLLARELRPANQQVWPRGWALRSTALPAAIYFIDMFREFQHVKGLSFELYTVCTVLAYTLPMATETQYMFMSSILALSYQRLGEHIYALQGPSRSPSEHWLDEVRRSHEQLVSLTCELHCLLGPQIFVTVSACLLSLLTGVYFAASAILEGLVDADGSEGVSMANQSDIVYFTARLIAICATADTVKAAAAAVVNGSIRVDYGTWHTNSKERWNMFLSQLETVTPSFSVAGIAKIGMGLLSGMIATTLTYLLVLLQFDTARITAARASANSR
ncbi:Gustatory receptor 94 [Frankliniella occidentalis]|uniref:Gustatory receptor n=1 Tax=Frankliniella occidentalis TaxID=133901 RepID=A0A9C6XTH5_FRAOC|nr:uncharacterized protein LOC127751332 [Frankliniella occidentalis]KAE8738716.1 Gustatory receptor 94 [Frankliniella occidentalis]